MIGKPVSDRGIQDSFNRILNEAISLGASGIRSESGLDLETMEAIDYVAQAFPNPDPALIRNARKELAKQLDGTHIRERREMLDAQIQNFYDS